MQKRDVFCQSANGTLVPDALCEASEKPTTKQECYNDLCKGTWRVGEWTEVRFSRKRCWTFLRWMYEYLQIISERFFSSVMHHAIKKEWNTGYYNAFGTVPRNLQELRAETCQDQQWWELVVEWVAQKVNHCVVFSSDKMQTERVNEERLEIFFW